MSVLSFITNPLSPLSEVESHEVSHTFDAELIRENTSKDGLRDLENYAIGVPGVPNDTKNYFFVFETAYKHWLDWHAIIPVLESVVILLRSPPKDRSGPEFAGYLLTEWEDPEYPGLVGLVMIPRPQVAHMRNEQFWDVELPAARVAQEPGYIGTRHGRHALNVKATADWVMSVDPDDLEDLAAPEETSDPHLRRYQLEFCRHPNGAPTHPSSRAPHNRARYARFF
ncbi:hypothetical protein F5Y13DRAFT_191061 [Hypoxylon sp. FL1857]|nr:hypothetical protein F5Y13DRAFT_191061 [Hypoxylon sp. FL1857]